MKNERDSMKKDVKVGELIIELERLFEERIVALHTASERDTVACASRHAFVLYRSILWQMMELLGVERL